MRYDVSHHGVHNDGQAVQTSSLQRVIDACAEGGGGTVFFPAGVYRTGTLILRSNLTIELEAGATLVGSGDLVDYPPFDDESEGRSTALLLARGEHDVSICGHGTIDGNDRAFHHFDRVKDERDYDPRMTRQGDAFAEKPLGVEDGPVEPVAKDGRQARPGTLILCIDCEQVRFTDVSVVGSPNWCVHLAGCRYATLRGLFIRNSMLVSNADCIDIGNSRYVSISDCVLEAGDDGIALSPCADGYIQRPTENVTVTNCSIKSRSAGIRVGYGIEPIRNVSFSNIRIYESNRGIGVFVRNGQLVENVTFSHITVETRQFSGWWGAAEPIHISAVGGYEYDGSLGTIRNVRFFDVTARGENGILLFGVDHDDGRCHIEDILLQNVRFDLVPSTLNERYGGNIDLRPAADARHRIFSDDLAGILAKNVDGLTLRNVEVHLADGLPAYLRRGLDARGCDRLALDGFAAVNADGSDAEQVTS